MAQKTDDQRNGDLRALTLQNIRSARRNWASFSELKLPLSRLSLRKCGCPLRGRFESSRR